MEIYRPGFDDLIAKIDGAPWLDRTEPTVDDHPATTAPRAHLTAVPDAGEL